MRSKASAPTRVSRPQNPGGTTGKKAGNRQGKRTFNPLPPPPRAVEIEPLDPWLLCGPDTTVTELWRVREQVGAARVFHLVFFDRYGWYCEHGRECPAVRDVRQFIKALGPPWASSDRRVARETER